MTAGEAAWYLGVALLYACLLTVALLAAARVAGPSMGWQPDARHALTLLLVLFFIFLTQHPFPDPATLNCAGGGMPALLLPFGFLDRFAERWAEGAALAHWVRDKVVMSSIMNFVLCAAIGAALSRHVQAGRRYLKVLGFAVALSVGVETAQLTGLFGLYPCAYRHFEVDDLILNIGGTVAGFAVGVRLVRHREVSSTSN